ncbi:hypothetical protein BD410DRAFT_568809 [Rickenella mellea]|uniref:Uncharacterized protein n=1 Tax=Rickenella mellea TaxID=50990 RepID=A0A4Y7QGB6_9AGAM|nr:hypothetical protein BD410DRAFT_568809 [Rickenella mellea]
MFDAQFPWDSDAPTTRRAMVAMMYGTSLVDSCNVQLQRTSADLVTSILSCHGGRTVRA